jgi:hypothetical protein
MVTDDGLKAKPDPLLTARTEALIGNGTGVGFGVGFGVAGIGVAGRVAAGVGVGVGVVEALAVGEGVAVPVGVVVEAGIAACWPAVPPQAVSNRTSAVVTMMRGISPGATDVGYARPDSGAR